jgi:hypothetical protein
MWREHLRSYAVVKQKWDRYNIWIALQLCNILIKIY